MDSLLVILPFLLIAGMGLYIQHLHEKPKNDEDEYRNDRRIKKDFVYKNVAKGTEQLYQKYFEEILNKIDLKSLTSWAQNKSHLEGENEKNAKSIVEITNRALDERGLFPQVLLVMLLQYIFADVYQREINKSKWIYKVMNREDIDYFPDSNAIIDKYHWLFE